MGLHTIYVMAILDEGVVLHMQGCEVISVQVGNPGTELVVSSHDKANFFAVNCMANWQFSPALVASKGGVLRLYHIAEEHCIPTILRYHLIPIDGVGVSRDPGAGFNTLH